MSENEKIKRQEYKRNRRRWILIQSIALALAVLLAVGFYAVYDRMNRIYYIEYSEGGYVDYRVYLDDNSFFEEDFVGKDHAYIARLIKAITADFVYTLDMENTTGVSFDYEYGIDARLTVADKTSGDPIISPVYELVPKTQVSVKGEKSLTVSRHLEIDYDHYNEFASSFLGVYDLHNASAVLSVTMTVEVLSSCEEFEGNESAHFISLNIPLAEENFSIYSTSTNPEQAKKVLACSSGVNQDLFLAVSVAAAVLAALLLVVLAVYVTVTRNEDINYTNKVRKLLSAYRSYIQQIEGAFDVTGYQVVPIKTFTEMLGIRDTIQSPILMFENEDQTKTEFIISTNTRILYLFEIKVDNYDELYGSVTEETAEEAAAE